MSIDEKLAKVTALANEKENLESRLAEIDDELSDLFGEKPVRAAKPGKAKKSGGGVKPAAGKGGVKHACCGSKQMRHKKSCAKSEGKLPSDETPLKWECIDCSEKIRSVERPDVCPACEGKAFVQK